MSEMYQKSSNYLQLDPVPLSEIQWTVDLVIADALRCFIFSMEISLASLFIDEKSKCNHGGRDCAMV
jgi:hypothetical protein